MSTASPDQSALLSLGDHSHLLELLPIAAYAVRAPHGVITWYNSQAAKLWGRVPVIGDTDERFCGAYKLYHPDGSYMAHCDTPVELALRTGASAHEEEVVIERPDGSRVTVSVHIDPIRDKVGKIIGVVNFFHDITERKAKETERQQLYEEVKAHAARLREAHEQLELKVEQRTASLRTLSSQLMQLQDNERRRISRDLHDSVGQCLVGLQLTLNAVVRSNDDSVKREKLKESVTLLDEAMREVRTVSYLLHPPMLDLAGLEPAIRWYVEGFNKRSPIELHLEIPKDLPRLPIEKETAAFRVVQECLTNVHRYSQAPNAWIRIAVTPDKFRLEVQDDGKGIGGAHLSMKPAGEISFGVGIPGMRERLRELGGSLEIQSSGHGTRIIATIPLNEGHPGESKRDPSALPGIEPGPAIIRNASRKRILIVDDHQVMRRGVRTLIDNEPDLEVCGEATNALEAVEMTKQLMPDIVLLDLQMPGGNGWEVVRGIRKFEFWTRVLIFSAHNLPEIERRARAAECEGYVSKSQDCTELLEALRLVLGGQIYYRGPQTAAQTA
jgi:signal transduction histidine kinase/CheY-like chemotaxis protein